MPEGSGPLGGQTEDQFAEKAGGKRLPAAELVACPREGTSSAAQYSVDVFGSRRPSIIAKAMSGTVSCAVMA